MKNRHVDSCSPLSEFKRRANQHGQALTEFLVLAVALVPLFLLMPLIAKYQDIGHATQLASRYVAFEATNRNAAQNSWKPESQLADEVRRRFFSNAEAPIKTYDVPGDFKANQNLFWRTPNDQPLIHKFSDVSVTFGAGAGPAHGDGLSSANDGAVYSGHEMAGLAASGLYTANVSVPLVRLPAGIKSFEPFDQLDLLITRSTSVLFDPWAVNSAVQTEERVRALAPVSAALSTEPIPTLLGLGIQSVDFSLPRVSSPTLSGQVEPPQFGKLEQWRDVVPGDRLRAAP